MTTQQRGTHVQVHGLQKILGGRAVLHELNLNVEPGQFVVVVGRSGCGKSTLLRLIAGLSQPDAGSIRVDGKPLAGINGAARVIFQDPRLLPWKRVIDNVGVGLKGSWQGRAREALAHVGLQDRAREWPGVLSGGERQRVALARALMHDPPLLLLDEPLGALDALTRLEMQRLVEGLWQESGYTALLITHDVEEALALADRIVLIEEGHIALDLEVSLPRPRQQSSPEFVALRERLLSRIMSWTPETAQVEATRRAKGELVASRG